MNKKQYAELRGLITQYFGTQRNFSKILGISTVSLNEKLNGKVQFKQNEIAKAKEVLNLDAEDVERIFFNKKI